MSRYYIGLDIHKDSIQTAVLDDRKKEPVAAKGLPNRAARVVKEWKNFWIGFPAAILTAWRENGRFNRGRVI
jgi:hypothetical protein